MKKILIVPLLALLMGCASFSTHVFRTEQTAVNLVYAGYVGWTNYLIPAMANTNLSLAKQHSLLVASNEVKQARLRFAATVHTVEEFRLAYETNAALRPQLEAALFGLLQQSSNVVYLIYYWRQP